MARMMRRALIALAFAGLAFGALVAYVIAESDHTDDRGATAALALLVGWSFIGTGLFAWWRRPANRTGALMTGVGFAWFATSLSASDDDAVFTVGIALDALFTAVLGHLLLAFPSGRLETRLERALVVGIYAVCTVLQVPALLFEEVGEPRNLLVVESDQGLSDVLDALQLAFVLPLTAVGITIIVKRSRTVVASQRAALEPVLWTGGVALVVFGVAKVFDAAGSPHDGLDALALVLFATVPYGFLAGLLRSRLAAGAAVSELIARLGSVPGEEDLRAALADALGDPSLSLAYWLPESERFVDAEGRRLALRDGAWTEVRLQERRIAAIVHDPALAEEPDLVRAAGAAAALALENQRLSAELRARIVELRASRARLVEASDAERRRLERNLHDGAQSRLVALALKLRLTRSRVEDDSEAATMLDESSQELQASLAELRELARGIHPSVLTDRGLPAALRALADRAPVPVHVFCDLPEPLPPAVESAVYYVVAEALTNVGKYAQAEYASVAVETVGDAVRAEVADDGRGGANTATGSGLRGLEDRLGALDGRLEVYSPPGEGTRLRAEIPLK
jgi:signal transduction histidine kinase